MERTFWSIYLRVVFPGVLLVFLVLTLSAGSNWPWFVLGEAVVLVLMLGVVAYHFGIDSIFESRRELLEDAEGSEESAGDLVRDLNRDAAQAEDLSFGAPGLRR
ncbi:MAG: hypothetical protein L3K18_08740 [Thermoplasmata archaeon]|nr:hypothetical protein [Thermoplasmata archaeon]MCI4357203.1 hypothetical protein [Thermoplasmata archaeon]